MNRNYWENNYRGAPIADAYDGWLARYADVIRPGARVLDLGCGAGRNLPALIRSGAAVSAADFSESAVAFVEEGFGTALVHADCFDMRNGFPYADESFDAVVADLSLHYFSWADTQKIVAEIHRILVRGGCLIARLHSIRNLKCIPDEQIEPHYYIVEGYTRRYFTPDEIRNLFAPWKLLILEEREITRYSRQKQIIEFEAKKKGGEEE